MSRGDGTEKKANGNRKGKADKMEMKKKMNKKEIKMSGNCRILLREKNYIIKRVI